MHARGKKWVRTAMSGRVVIAKKTQKHNPNHSTAPRSSDPRTLQPPCAPRYVLIADDAFQMALVVQQYRRVGADVRHLLGHLQHAYAARQAQRWLQEQPIEVWREKKKWDLRLSVSTLSTDFNFDRPLDSV